MRALAGFLILIATAAPPTSMELHARYGKPDAERFAVRPDVTLTVEYGDDDDACAMRIEQRHNFFGDSSHLSPAHLDELTDVLNEVVPPEGRGKELGPGLRNSYSCADAPPPTEYENVTVNTYYGRCEQPLTVHGLHVHFKRPACEKIHPEQIPKSR